MKLIQLGLMHGGILPEDDDEDDIYTESSTTSPELTEEEADRLAPLPKRIRELVERRRRDKDSDASHPRNV